RVAELMQLSDEQLEILHDPERGGRSEFEYRLAWTRTYLKKFDLIENSTRGVWALTPTGRKTEKVNEKEVVRYVKEQGRIDREQRTEEEPELEDEDGDTTWQEGLLEVLLDMNPDAFERLVQRMLRESGFVQVEVTGRSGDGGIDGKGIMRLGGLLSFHVFFQCKRYKGSVGSSHVRDFRGAMTGRADKGLIITTGSFTKDATAEATRDGAPPIDLIDGDQLVLLLKDLSLGVKTELVKREEITIDKDWFLGI
ncbi:restriction endonuclease, partial [Chloroflexota bacterium]